MHFASEKDGGRGRAHVGTWKSEHTKMSCATTKRKRCRSVEREFITKGIQVCRVGSASGPSGVAKVWYAQERPYAWRR